MRGLDLLPGLAVALAVATAASGLNATQLALSGTNAIDTMTLAILLGIVFRAAFEPRLSWAPGIRFSSGRMLEFAVGLLGLSVDFTRLSESSSSLVASVVGIVIVSIAMSYWLCRVLGIGQSMAILIACGNSICGNSAITAVAPAIRATAQDVASAITFNAFLGFILLLVLPVLNVALGFTDHEYGIFAGLTVYAVPQVLAATAPVGLVAMQIGTMVKLMRVLMLGPVVLVMSWLSTKPALAAGEMRKPARLPGLRLFPWFIVLFVALVILRNTITIPEATLAAGMTTTKTLSIVAMAALGISVDIRQIMATSGRLMLAVSVSLVFLCLISIAAVFGISTG